MGKPKKVALVLSGGGANGAFQMAAEQFCRETLGLRWSIIAGQSVGALNAAMISMGRYHQLEHFWKTIRRRDIYRWPGLITMIKILFGRHMGIFNNKPLRRLITDQVVGRARIPLRYGAVDLDSGQYVAYTEKDLSPDTLLASASIPLMWTPVVKDDQRLIDGSVRHNGPLGDVLDADPDLIVIINCQPRIDRRSMDRVTGLPSKARRILEVMVDEGLVKDYEQFLQVNRAVEQAEAYNRRLPEGVAPIVLRNAKGRVLKSFDYVMIEPEESLGSPLDFSPKATHKRIQAGYRRAMEAFEGRRSLHN